VDQVVQLEASSDVQIELLKTWYHLQRADKKYYPDALIPVTNPYRASIPDSDNNIPGQTSQAFWVDVWVPRVAKPWSYAGAAALQAGSKRSSLKIQLQVLEATIPEDDALTVDHNSYGTAWLAQLYPKLREAQGERFFSSDALFGLIHAYQRIGGIRARPWQTWRPRNGPTRVLIKRWRTIAVFIKTGARNTGRRSGNTSSSLLKEVNHNDDAISPIVRNRRFQPFPLCLRAITGP